MHFSFRRWDVKIPRTGVVISDRYLDHDPGPGHPESPGRIKAIKYALKKRGLLGNESVSVYEPLIALLSEVRLIHTEEYISKINSICNAGGGAVSLDTVASKETYNTALLAVGGGLTAANKVLGGEVQNAFAFIRPPGHHASYAKANGFCFFNNIAVLAEYLHRNKGFSRIMIVDLDVHHGNGTQEIFYSSPYVVYLSLHQDGRTLYPGTGFPNEIGVAEGKGHIVNIPLPPGTAEESYMFALEEMLTPISDEFKPEFLLISWGFDTYSKDSIAEIKLSPQTYTKITNLLLKVAEKHCESRMVILLEGGYCIPVLGNLASNVVSALAGINNVYREVDISEESSIKPYVKKIISDLKSCLKPFWTGL